MTKLQSGAGLGILFGVFLGLMVAAFIGVGVYTFYPSPEASFRDRIEGLVRERQAIDVSKAPEALTASDRARIQQIDDAMHEAEDARRAAREAWGRTTSIVLVAFATLVMAISLLRAVQLPIVSDGLRLGGVFTMLYGVGWIVATDASVTRFLVLTVALAITLALGYVRFARPGGSVPANDRESEQGGLRDLDQRVRNLEERMDDAASALGRRGGE
jgi:hypothetical protein